MPGYTLQRVGQSLPWAQIQPDSSGTFHVSAGNRYAALVSLSRNFTKDQVQAVLAKRGWDVTYLWEWGDPNRGQYLIDDWLAGLSADARDNHRWVYGEANLTRDDSFGQDSPCVLFVCTTIYHVAVAYRGAGGDPSASPAPPPPATAPDATQGVAAPGVPTALGVAPALVGLALFLGVLFLRRS